MKPAEEYIYNAPENYRVILMHLQAVIVRTLPSVDLKFKYSLPYFYIDDKPFCHLNCNKNYVDLVFKNGQHLTKYTELLVVDGRKKMKSLRYTSLDEVNNTVLETVLSDAYAVRNEKF
ncbi:MAG: DUF1801 domain-containing protein [Cellulophaga sp.]|uniref:DUF1801 domain-containing protein n=1 Tax=unclassified Cellulophaga TaxID=2634405 RepID=UPI000C2C544A|nr:DUF1801 domain-containing protein [Cellulophaga sp. RHA19]PKB45060.1 uncharacterized protein DUF1801 [Cellulophaga sp. RHA19]